MDGQGVTGYDGGVLTSPAGTGGWGWVGCRLWPDPLAEQDAGSAPEPGGQERSWLSGQWSAEPWRMEIRYATEGRSARRPGAAPLTVTLLGQVHSSDAHRLSEAARALGGRLLSAPGGVVAGPLDEDGIREALAPVPLAQAVQRHGGIEEAVAAESLGLVEIRKRVESGVLVRPEAPEPLGVAFPRLAGGDRRWEPVWEELGGQPCPTVLGVCLEPYPVGSSAFQAGLRKLHAAYQTMATPRLPSPVFGRALEPDPFAQRAVAYYEDALRRYTERAYRLRLSLAAAGPTPLGLAELLADTLQAVVTTPHPSEKATAWGNIAGLGRTWLDRTYQMVPRDLGPVERVLSDLVDPAEAAAVFRFPRETPGRPRLFAVPSPPLPDVPQQPPPGAALGDDPGWPDTFDV